MRQILSYSIGLVLIFGFATGSTSHAQESHIQSPSAQELYLSGIKSYQSSKFEEASQNFRLAFAKEPQNRSILFNWGLSEYKQGRVGMAAAAWRRALAIDPDFSVARRALEVLAPELPSAQSLSDGKFFETFRSTVLVHISLTQVATATALFLLGAGWLLLTYLGKRRRALDEEQQLPSFPSIGIAFLVLFFLSSFTGLTKVYDFFQPRATVITTTASVFSGPSENSSSLFELAEGLEVIMSREKGPWRQVSSPGGLSGWVKQDSLFQTSGLQKW